MVLNLSANILVTSVFLSLKPIVKKYVLIEEKKQKAVEEEKVMLVRSFSLKTSLKKWSKWPSKGFGKGLPLLVKFAAPG